MIQFKIPGSAVFITPTEPVGKVTLKELRDKLISLLPDQVETAAIIVADKTRSCEYPRFLPVISDTLIQKGVKKRNITFYIAYGTHPRQSDKESYDCYGSIYDDYQFIHHNCKDISVLRNLGTTSRGTEITIRDDIYNNDLVITFGAISHHYFAGYGGGRKLIFPGLGGYNAILQNHRLLLDFNSRKLNPECRSGNLVTNPIANDLAEIEQKFPSRIDLYSILHSNGEVAEIVAGVGNSEFNNACRRYDTYYKSREERLFDLVIASTGGYPKDINFIQSHKSIHAASSFVRDGGKLLIWSECKDGTGNNTFIDLFRLGGWNEIFTRMDHGYENNGGTALSLMNKTRRIKIYMVTSLTQDMCNLLGIKKTTISEAEKMPGKEHGSIAYLENASMVFH